MFGPFHNPQTYNSYERFFCIMYVPDGRVLSVAMNARFPKWICSFSTMYRDDYQSASKGTEEMKKDVLYKIGLDLERTKGVFRSVLTFREAEHNSSPSIRVYEYIPCQTIKLTPRADVLVRALPLSYVKEAMSGPATEFDYSTELVLKKLISINRILGANDANTHQQ